MDKSLEKTCFEDDEQDSNFPAIESEEMKDKITT